GSIRGERLGRFVLSVERNTVAANITLPGEGDYQIRYLSAGLHDICELGRTEKPICGGAIPVTGEQMAHAVDSDRPELSSASVRASDNGSEMDLLVVYTPAAEAGAGGPAAMTALLNLMVDETNIAYSQSQVFPRLRLVYTGQISYTESGNSSTDLSRLQRTSDGYMDTVHSLRNSYGADMVCLIVESSDVGGRAYLMTTLTSAFAPWAFSLVKRGSGTGYILGHELGHNMGCHHAVGDGGTPRGAGLYPYSHGWRWYGDSGMMYRSIMAYFPGLTTPHFSNPNVLYEGEPTGRVDSEDNARTINNAAYTISNWRRSVVPHSPPRAYDSNVPVSRAESKTITLQARDDGQPRPPGALTFVIESLPMAGVLSDPCAGAIQAVPYALTNYGRQVVYTPDPGLNCMDRFRFTASDGGVPPEGGDSNLATVMLNVVFGIYSADMQTDPRSHRRGVTQSRPGRRLHRQQGYRLQPFRRLRQQYEQPSLCHDAGDTLRRIRKRNTEFLPVVGHRILQVRPRRRSGFQRWKQLGRPLEPHRRCSRGRGLAVLRVRYIRSGREPIGCVRPLVNGTD
ncbi:MAG: reprolysin-like metallopeptidase, partial [Planctomycetota bacterium]